MDQHSARNAVLGLEGLGGRRLAAEIEAVRDAVVGDRHQKISDAPADAVEPGALRTMGFTRDPDALFDLALDIAAHRVRERAVVDSQHHLEVEEEASHVERSEEHTSELQSLMRISYA